MPVDWNLRVYSRLHYVKFQVPYVPSLRNMCTKASSVSLESKDGLQLLVHGGSRAQKMVGIWLFGSAAWVFSMVILGGVTRLTRSGLSMTDWKFTGSLPPLSDEEWLVEFEKYKQSPEYKRLAALAILFCVECTFFLCENGSKTNFFFA